jgi:hypothetical protein
MAEQLALDERVVQRGAVDGDRLPLAAPRTFMDRNALATDLEARLTDDPEVGRAALTSLAAPTAPRRPRAKAGAPENSKSLERAASPGIPRSSS